MRRRSNDTECRKTATEMWKCTLARKVKNKNTKFASVATSPDSKNSSRDVIRTTSWHLNFRGRGMQNVCKYPFSGWLHPARARC